MFDALQNRLRDARELPLTDADLVAAVVDGHFESLGADGAWLPAPLPDGMTAGPENEDGWAPWRLLPSTVTGVDLAQLEESLPAPLPAAFKAYLQYRCVLATEALLLPEIPTTDPLGPLRFEIKAWAPLLAAGYIPFAEFGDGYGPVCLDALSPEGQDDYAVVWFDHEDLHTLGMERVRDRQAVARFREPLFDSFRALLEDACKHLGAQ